MMPDIQTDESDASEIRPEPDQQKTEGSPAARPKMRRRLKRFAGNE